MCGLTEYKYFSLLNENNINDLLNTISNLINTFQNIQAIRISVLGILSDNTIFYGKRYSLNLSTFTNTLKNNFNLPTFIESDTNLAVSYYVSQSNLNKDQSAVYSNQNIYHVNFHLTGNLNVLKN